MIPVGYMAKRIPRAPEGLVSPHVLDIYSVSDCVNDNFADYVDYWKHNGWWFFDSPDVIQSLSREHSIDLRGAHLFYYEVYELECHEGHWRSFSPWADGWKDTHGVVAPAHKVLEGYDVVTFWVENSPDPEHSPLSCNGVASDIRTNAHCLFEAFAEARAAINADRFNGCEPGAMRIFAVYSVDWPQAERGESPAIRTLPGPEGCRSAAGPKRSPDRSRGAVMNKLIPDDPSRGAEAQRYGGPVTVTSARAGMAETAVKGGTTGQDIFENV